MKNEKDHSFKLCQLVIFEWINVLKQSELKNIMSCNVLKDLQCLQGNSLEGMLFDRAVCVARFFCLHLLVRHRNT